MVISIFQRKHVYDSREGGGRLRDDKIKSLIDDKLDDKILVLFWENLIITPI